MNLGIIRRYYVEKWSDMIKEKTSKKESNKKEENDKKDVKEEK